MPLILMKSYLVNVFFSLHPSLFRAISQFIAIVSTDIETQCNCIERLSPPLLNAPELLIQ